MPFIAKVARMLDDGSPTKHSRNIMMASRVDTYTILGSSDTFLPEHSLAALETAVYDCLSNYCFLAHVAMTSGQVRYNVVQTHLGIHRGRLRWPRYVRCANMTVVS